MRKHLATVLKYFAFFSYAPTISEIHMFFPVFVSLKNLRLLLKAERNKKNVVQLPKNKVFRLFQGLSNHYSFRPKVYRPLGETTSKYTLPQYSIPRTIQTYLSILKWLPFVRFVGITGATAMTGYIPHDDVDLFIITKKDTLWTTRFFVVVLAKLLGIYGGVGVCLNLFFDEIDLTIPKIKQNSYIAHEILQMKPVIDKDNTYRILIEANTWIFSYFPNAQSRNAKRITQNVKRVEYNVKPKYRKTLYDTRYTLHEHVERIFKSIQLPVIKRNKTGFRITNHQLWLFRRDFENKLKREGLAR